MSNREEMLGNLPLQYFDGPDYCTVKDATGGDFALTVQPELMKMMEDALSAQSEPGYVAVPTVPTKEMLEAGVDNNPTSWNDNTDPQFMIDVANDVYVAMVKATLPAPATAGSVSTLYLDRTEVRVLLIQRGDETALRAVDQLPIFTADDIAKRRAT